MKMKSITNNDIPWSPYFLSTPIVTPSRKTHKESERKKAFNLFDCIKPTYIAARVFGQLPFTIHCNSNGELTRASVGAFDVLWFIGAIILNLVCVYFTLSSLQISFVIESSVLLNGSRLITIFGFLMAPIFIVLDMINRNRLVKILRDLSNFDDNVRKFRLSSKKQM